MNMHELITEHIQRYLVEGRRLNEQIAETIEQDRPAEALLKQIDATTEKVKALHALEDEYIGAHPCAGYVKIDGKNGEGDPINLRIDTASENRNCVLWSGCCGYDAMELYTETPLQAHLLYDALLTVKATEVD
jgi:hypothetical protein